jgi:hypothetical protein
VQSVSDGYKSITSRNFSGVGGRLLGDAGAKVPAADVAAGEASFETGDTVVSVLGLARPATGLPWGVSPRQAVLHAPVHAPMHAPVHAPGSHGILAAGPRGCVQQRAPDVFLSGDGKPAPRVPAPAVVRVGDALADSVFVRGDEDASGPEFVSS